MPNQKLYQIGLTMVNGIGDVLGRQLLQTLGNAEAIFKEKANALEKIPGIGRVLATEIKRSDVLKQAEKELSFIEKNKITSYFILDDGYPFRLREFSDAPLLLYFKGSCDLNAKRIVSIVGTRKITEYGKDACERLIAGLAEKLPDLLIASGLAYGTDIAAHRNALKYQLPTLAVLAHGLDRIYPQIHRPTAVEMLENGGLLTDFPSETNPDKPNFVKRNRIIAGLADATIVIESADKGGSLITADIAFSYSRDVFAIPGRITDTHSQGCNRIIRQNKAGLITCAIDVISAMSWDIPVESHIRTPAQSVQTELIFSENEENNPILAILRKKEGMQINQLAVEMDIPVHKLSDMLFELEIGGLIKITPGNVYRII
ncbi:MAG: DNA-processing protein DprA [Tannerellaceae bacterium]|jgi:DNA processing protein|nr:DNA-processing protein DprA [Tannerellaceae bacterium]